MICLVGVMGAGKSTAARSLARDGLHAVDLDELIEQREGRPVASLFEEVGEDRFREIEAALALETLADPKVEALALGGGTVLSPEVRNVLSSGEHSVVWLRQDPADAWRRVEGSGRPLARDREAFLALYAEREDLYREVADAVIVGETRTATESLREALALLGGATPEKTRLIWVGLATGAHPVLIGPGLDLARLLAPGGPLAPGAGRSVLVWDSNVAAALGDRFGEVLGPVDVPPGEGSKSLGRAEDVMRLMAELGTARSDRVVAAGGGVVGDLAGFCAATYQRGIDLVQVPTTLVAQVDSAYGGKTGVDLPEGKNYVGAFHQPVSVLTDTSLLETLPDEELSAGMAEVVKTGLLAGGTLWDSIRNLEPGEIRSRPDVIFECALHKCEVVAVDELDRDLRATLNLGHTVGHAIETATGYDRYRHGEAVALGLLAALELSGAPELRSEVAEVNARHGLPVRLDGSVEVDRIQAAIAFDKKKTAEGVAFILLEEPGRPGTGALVPDSEVRSAIEGLTS